MTPADAEETVQEAIRLFVNAGGVADASDPKGLKHAVGSQINGIAANRHRNKLRQAVRGTIDGYAQEIPALGDPEQHALSRDIAQKSMSLLLERIEKDKIVEDIVMQMAEGVDSAQEQAAVLGVSVADIYNARRRLNNCVLAVKELMETW